MVPVPDRLDFLRPEQVDKCAADHHLEGRRGIAEVRREGHGCLSIVDKLRPATITAARRIPSQHRGGTRSKESCASDDRDAYDGADEADIHLHRE